MLEREWPYRGSFTARMLSEFRNLGNSDKRNLGHPLITLITHHSSLVRLRRLGPHKRIINRRQRIKVRRLPAKLFRVGAIAFPLIRLAQAAKIVRVLLIRGKFSAFELLVLRFGQSGNIQISML